MEAILTATSRVLVREGYEATTTTRVAQVAGVSIGSLYQYFPSKEALVAELIDEHVAKVLQVLAEAFSAAGDEPLERSVRRFVRTVLLLHAVDPELHATLTRHLADVGAFANVAQLNRDMQALVVGYLERHRARLRSHDLELSAFIVVTSVQAIVSAAVLDRTRRADDEHLIDELTALVVRFL